MCHFEGRRLGRVSWIKAGQPRVPSVDYYAILSNIIRITCDIGHAQSKKGVKKIGVIPRAKLLAGSMFDS